MSTVFTLGDLNLLAAPYRVLPKTQRFTLQQGKPTLQFMLEAYRPGQPNNNSLWDVVGDIQEQINLARESRRHNAKGSGVYVEIALDADVIVRWRVVDGQDVLPTPGSINGVWLTKARKVEVPMALQVEALRGHADRVDVDLADTYSNTTGTVLIEGVQGHHAAPLRLRLSAAEGQTLSGFRVGLRTVPEGTVASDWTGLLNLTAIGGSTPTDGNPYGGSYVQHTLSSMTSWTALAKAEQPSGDLWKGRFITFGRLYDDPGTPSVTAVSGLTGAIVTPSLTGYREVLSPAYMAPVIADQGTPSAISGTAATRNYSFLPLGFASATESVYGIVLAEAAPGFAVSSFSVPANWTLEFVFGLGTEAAIAILRRDVTSSGSISASTTVTFSGSNAHTVSGQWYRIIDPSGGPVVDLVAGGAASASQGVQGFSSQRSALYANELILLAIQNPPSETISRAYDGWTIDTNVSGGLAVLRDVGNEVGQIGASWVNSLGGTSGVVVMIGLKGEYNPALATEGGQMLLAGNLREGYYTGTVQRLDNYGNASAPATPVVKEVTQGGSRIDWSWAAGSGGPYLFSFETPDGRFRQVQTREPRYSLTDDDVGSVILALPTVGVAVARPSLFQVRAGTVAEADALSGLSSVGAVTLADADSWQSKLLGAWDWPRTAASDDGDRPDAAVVLYGVSGSPANATVKLDMLRLFDADGVVFSVHADTPAELIHLELLPDGTVTAWGESGDGSERTSVTVVGEPRIPPGTVLMSLEHLGAVSEPLRSYGSTLTTTYTIDECSYLPEFSLQAGTG